LPSWSSLAEKSPLSNFVYFSMSSVINATQSDSRKRTSKKTPAKKPTKKSRNVDLDANKLPNNAVDLKQLPSTSLLSEADKKMQQQHVLSHATEAGLFPTPNVVGKFNCYFLKKDSQLIMKFAATQLVISRYETLTVFNFPASLRANFEALVDDWMQTAVPALPGMTTENPFRQVPDKSGEGTRPVFLRLSAMCTYYKQMHDGYVRECSKKERPEIGKCFRGRVAMMLKGVKFDQETCKISPMIVAGQVLEFQPPLPCEMSEADLIQRQCVLLDDQSEVKVDANEAQQQQQQVDTPERDFFDEIFGYEKVTF